MGTYSHAGDSTCSACEPGYFAPAGSRACTKANAGYKTAVGRWRWDFAHCGVAHSDRSSTVDKSAEVECPIGTSAPSGATKCVSLRTRQEIVAEQIYVVEKNKACVSGLSVGALGVDGLLYRAGRGCVALRSVADVARCVFFALRPRQSTTSSDCPLSSRAARCATLSA